MVDNVQGMGSVGPSNQNRRLRKAYRPEAEIARASDAVEMSQDLQKLKNIKGIRLEKVLEVRKALAEGTYVTDTKLDQALDHAIDEAFGDTEPQ